MAQQHDDRAMRFLEENRLLWVPTPKERIHSLSLSGELGTDENLRIVVDLPALKEVCLQGARVTDAGLAILAEQAQLESLDVRSCHGISNKGMAAVSRMRGLKELELYDTSIGDPGLRCVCEIPTLEKLNLHSTRVTDLGLRQLREILGLKTLAIGGPSLNDAALEHVGQLHSLERLMLGESAFTDAGLKFLGNLTRLKHLSVAWSGITGDGFQYLGALKKLESLHASESRFTDAGMEWLVPLTSLKTIALDKTKITDRGIMYLKALTKLRDLAVHNTLVTKTGSDSLKKHLPRCIIRGASAAKVQKSAADEPDYLWTHPPRCIREFIARPLRTMPATTFLLACSCNSEIGAVLGHPLSQFNPEYTGSEFVGPLAFRCSNCQKTTELIDTDKHGYDGETGSSVTFRGRGRRRAAKCPKCDSSRITATVHFAYDGAERELQGEDPSIPVEDYFGSFSARGSCVECGSEFSIAEFECS